MKRYRDGVLLGAGAMGEVYRAHDSKLDRPVAIKFLRWWGESARERFIAEARAAARVSHPNVVVVHDYGEHAGKLFLVQEYVRGADLETLLAGRETRSLPWRQVLALCTPLADGLAAVHRGGLLHRDIKPGNVMIAHSGAGNGSEHGLDTSAAELGLAKLIDFGVAKFLDADTAAAPDTENTQTGDRTPDGHAAPHTANAATRPGQIIGTPRYMAPEVLRGEPATSKSDVYSFGALMYELCAGHDPRHDIPDSQLLRAAATGDIRPLIELVPAIDSQLAKVVHRCLERAPEERFDDGHALWQALVELRATTASQPVPEGNPFRGLRTFEAEHRALFFGRDGDIDRVVERLKTQPLLCVPGMSGVGKSSLLRAGVLPAIEEFGLGDGRAWRSIIVTPGKRPLRALAAALATPLQADESELAKMLASDIGRVVERARQRHDTDHGLVIFVDQLEELVTLVADGDERARMGRALVALAERVRGVRVVATLRSDKLGELAEVPAFEPWVVSATEWLHPLDPAAIERVITSPVAVKGFAFESLDTVHTLVDATRQNQAGLPLLQFALSQLWETRDEQRKVIPADALDRIGGVAGALARHADNVVQSLEPPATYEAAKHIFLRLTDRETRTHLSEVDLAAGSEARHAAIVALVKARLLVVRLVAGVPAYEIAHEALFSGWPTLRNWIAQQDHVQRLASELRRAADNWQAHGRSNDYLWRGELLRDARQLDEDQVERRLAREFLHASRRWELRMTAIRRSVAVAVVALIVAGYGAFRYKATRDARIHQARVDAEISRDLGTIVQSLEPLLEEPDGRYATLDSSRRAAIAAFQGNRWQQGEQAWRAFLDSAPAVEQDLTRASRDLRYLLQRNPGRDDVKVRLIASLRKQARLTYHLGHDVLHRDAVAELEQHDRSENTESAWNADIQVSLTTTPAGLDVTLCRYRDPGGSPTCNEVAPPTRTPATWSVAPGSYAFVLSSNGKTADMRYPFLLEPTPVRGAAPATFDIAVPPLRDVPEGYIYVHEGEFLFGFGRNPEDEALRSWYETLPMHRRRTASFLIARNEISYRDWLEFLRDQPADVVNAYLPDAEANTGVNAVRLFFDPAAPERARLVFEAAPEASYDVSLGQDIVYPERERNARHDWTRFPVTGVTVAAVRAYAAWLGSERRERPIPGARLCTEEEWERAARGADVRKFPHRSRLEPGDANFDETYDRRPGGYGFDEVGSHARSRSPFGALNMVGNAREKTTALFGDLPIVNRGGSYYQGWSTGGAANRDPAPEDHKDAKIGYRICADWSPVTPSR